MIKLKNINKVYDLGPLKVNALSEVNLDISKGDFITIMGPSGSGKSTLLHILGLLDQPTTGIYSIDENDITYLSDKYLSKIRNKHFGFVFQNFNLLSEFNVIENVILPLMFTTLSLKSRKEKARKLLTDLGLSHRMYHYPNMLSGGEQQRVGIARALINDPELILADEPTGNLPSKMGIEIISLLCCLNDTGVTIALVTHDDRIGMYGKRMIRLKDGSIESDESIKDRIEPKYT